MTDGSMEVTDQVSWYSTVEPDTVSNTTVNLTLTEPHPAVLTLPDWLLYTYCGLLGFGLLSNSLNLMVISKLQSSVMYIYLQWIALFELCFCIFLVPGTVMIRIGYTTSYMFAWLNSYVFMLLWYVAASVSMLLTVVIGYDRIYHIRRPLVARTNVTKTRARVMVAVVVLLCLVLRLPFTLNLEIVSYVGSEGQVLYHGTMISPLKSGFIAYLTTTGILFDYFCPISMAVCSAIILHYKRKIENQRKQLLAMHLIGRRLPGIRMRPTPANASQEEKLMVVLVTMSLMSITCNVPVTILRLIWPSPAQQFVMKHVANLLFVVDHISNVFIYTATDRKYWEQLVVVLRPCRQKETPPPEQLTRVTSITSVTFGMDENVSLKSFNTISQQNVISNEPVSIDPVPRTQN